MTTKGKDGGKGGKEAKSGNDTSEPKKGKNKKKSGSSPASEGDRFSLDGLEAAGIDPYLVEERIQGMFHGRRLSRMDRED